MPVCIIHKTTADSKGSCSKYTFYLNKENQELIAEKKYDRQQFFFDQHQNKLSSTTAMQKIDQNTRGKGLTRKEDKYFTVTLNFSEKELSYLAEKATGRKGIDNVNQMSKKEFEKYNTNIREYARNAMKNYASNFRNNISKNDIVYFGKTEHKRKYKGTEKEVINGKAKSGELKPGLQSHVHIVVSRSHKEKRIRLSPHRSARNTNNHKLRGRNVPNASFDRMQWVIKNEQSFDRQFKYERSLNEKFEVQYALKNGTPEEKIKYKSLIQENNLDKSKELEL
ncbi:hypothetical protein ATE84_1244 [Aquimarina sp. MAR_2010_214]|uniref:DUF5712 family protein n=1 Tax=Aquimarina sp. MAR_2010_214 TaxID=1250026 RepID=UPI000C70742C|nr:DUF5712 family protein [Aquimarina sp. MAR_2010_214]PKV49224.1 hypothetical protein ATE84_1244 [Aquimarina sp. MAR_2010_214]